MKKQWKTIGIIGGLGPEATLDLYRWILRLTPAVCDQDHIPVIIYSCPQIPDRTQAILHDSKSPLLHLIRLAKFLKNEVDFIIIPCNTTHVYLEKLQNSIKFPVINMIEEVVNYIETFHPKVKRIGLLATTGTIKARIYHNFLEKKQLEIFIPEKGIQEKVMEAIYKIKAGLADEYPKSLLKDAAEYLHQKGASLVIMGCTEIPLALREEDVNFLLINPTKILAQAAISAAKCK